jgi:hypothetical protein
VPRVLRAMPYLPSLRRSYACNTQGDNRKRQSTIREAIRLRTFVNNLTEFADALYKACRKTHAAATWSLELRYPEAHRTVKDWDHTELVDIDFTFLLGRRLPPSPPPEKRFRVSNGMGVSQMPAVTENSKLMILGQPPVTTVVSEQSPPSRKIALLRHLFRDGFFDADAIYTEWEGDRARLALGFVNWTLLLRNTKRTNDLCCCWLKFVKPVTGGAHCVHTLITERHDHCSGDL